MWIGDTELNVQTHEMAIKWMDERGKEWLILVERIYAVTSTEFPREVGGGVSVSGVAVYSASDEGLLFFSSNSIPLLVKEGWEGWTFSAEGLTGSTESICNAFHY